MTSSSPGRFSIASWNVHMGLHNDGGRNDVTAGVAALDADVVALQEASWIDSHTSIADEVAAALGYSCVSFTAAPPPDRPERPGWTVAILSRLPMTANDGPRLVSRSGFPTRRAVSASIAIGDARVDVAALHLSGIHWLRFGPHRLRPELAALSHVASDHDVVLGDLNLWGPVIARSAAPLRRAVLGRTWPAWRPHSQIDHLLVAERLHVVSASVQPDRGSDHLAIRAELVVGQ